MPAYEGESCDPSVQSQADLKAKVGIATPFFYPLYPLYPCLIVFSLRLPPACAPWCAMRPLW